MNKFRWIKSFVYDMGKMALFLAIMAGLISIATATVFGIVYVITNILPWWISTLLICLAVLAGITAIMRDIGEI